MLKVQSVSLLTTQIVASCSSDTLDANIQALPEHLSRYAIGDGISTLSQSARETNRSSISVPAASTEHSPVPNSVKRISLQQIPEEIQQSILDILVGTLRPTSSLKKGQNNPGMRNWSAAMRHPRGKNVSNLSVVSVAWRRMIQERLYRHIKLKATISGLQECAEWFSVNTHLQEYVRHIEFWVPVWERRVGYKPQYELLGTLTLEQVSQPHGVITVITPSAGSREGEDITSAYQLSSENATLDEIFNSVDCFFPAACIMSIEGGHCRKPPMLRQFRNTCTVQELKSLPQIKTLILKGAWNIIREDSHFQVIARALTGICELHVTYSKPKAKGYLTMSNVLQNFPPTITQLNLCVEAFYNKEGPSVTKMRRLQAENHLCTHLGRIIPQLDALTLSGRFCKTLLKTAIETADKVRRPRLRSLDLIVRNCCRELSAWNDGTGIHNWGFIKAFESVVVATSKALRDFPELQFIRIRYLDLDAQVPFLNPYFLLQNNQCTGIWNDEILANISNFRPSVSFTTLSDNLGTGLVERDGRPTIGWPMGKPKSIKVSSYIAFADFSRGP